MRAVIVRTLVSSLLLSVVGAVCGACSASADDPAANRDPLPTPACVEGETRCEGDAIATCARDAAGALAFSAPTACDGEGVCKAKACVSPSPTQLAQATELEKVLRYVRDNTAWHSPLDWSSLVTRGRREIFRGEGGGRDYFGALFHAFIAVPQGHQGLYLDARCGVDVPMPYRSVRGACGRPHPRGVIVTFVRPGNALGLSAGDVVVRLASGAASSAGAMLTELGDRPMCAVSRPSASYRDASVAATFSDLLREGETIEIESPSGARRTVTVGPLGAAGDAIACDDPLGRPTSVAVQSYVRPDGVGVIRLPSFVDPEQTFPTSGSLEEIEAYRERFEAKIQAAFDAVKSAPAIVWDIRGNGGGLTMVGLDIASGFVGATGGEISYCRARIVRSDPPRFGAERYATYQLSPGGRFAYSGKVGVLTDGLNYSAADYFPLAVKLKTGARIFGSKTAGAFGATSKTASFAGPPSFLVSVDLNRCSLAADDSDLEGASVEPHVVVEYEPADLVEGRDTILERAAAALLY